MLGQALREGFTQAHRRPGLIILDILWKGIWFALTLTGLLTVVYQFVSHVQWQSSNIRAIDAWVAAGLLRQLWNDYGGEFIGGLIATLGLSALAWLYLEAVFRRKLASACLNPRPKLSVFIASTAAKLMILTGVAAVLGALWLQSHDVAIPALAAFAALAFLLTVLDTLIRIDAVDLLGVDLLGVAGLIGTLLLFESLIAACLAIVVIFGFLSVSSVAEALVMFAVTTLVLFILNFLHSYLLLVRFSAVGIMKRDAIDV